jgi:hypothetical protein
VWFLGADLGDMRIMVTKLVSARVTGRKFSEYQQPTGAHFVHFDSPAVSARAARQRLIPHRRPSSTRPCGDPGQRAPDPRRTLWKWPLGDNDPPSLLEGPPRSCSFNTIPNRYWGGRSSEGGRGEKAVSKCQFLVFQGSSQCFAWIFL